MANLYAVTDSYQLIYNPAVSGDFSGYMQSVGGNTITCKIADSLPSDDVGSFEIELGDSIETILNGYYIRVDGLVDATLNTGLQLYAKTASGDGTLSLIAPTAISVGGDPISDSNPIPTKSVATPTNKSGTITTGGTAQVLMAANSKRQGIEFYNNSSGSLWLNVVGTATAGGGSIEVRSGGYWSPPVCPVTAISVIGATTGQAFTCWEYAPIDPSLTLALLHFDGANNSTVFTDSSPFNQTVSVVTGTPKISTDMSKFGGSSLYLDGSSAINIPNNANLNLGTGVFTIEFWFYLTSLSISEALFLHKMGTPQQVIAIGSPSGKVYGGFLYGTAISTTVITTGAWYHVAEVRETENGDIKQYINGVHEGTINLTGSVDNAGDLTIGSGFGGGNNVTGYIDEFRIRKEAMYLANFTPPTAPFTY